MKITISETQLREIEAPKYFKSGNDYFMTFGEKSVVRVTFTGLDSQSFESLFVYPRIDTSRISVLCVGLKSITPISEAEFKNAFIQASIEIEKLSN